VSHTENLESEQSRLRSPDQHVLCQSEAFNTLNLKPNESLCVISRSQSGVGRNV